MMVSARYFLILFLAMLVRSEETVTESFLTSLPRMLKENPYLSMHNEILPPIQRTSRKMQSMIVKITQQFSQMQEYKDVIDQSCLSSAIVVHMTKLSRNLTRLMQTDVPSFETELRRIMPKMNDVKQGVEELADQVKGQRTPLFNLKQLQRSQELTQRYGTLNKEVGEINRQLKQMINEIIRPGLQSVNEYNACLRTVGQSLHDYGIDQLVEQMDDDDDDEELDSSQDWLSPSNRAEL